jgi:hypothetical protein
VILFSAGFEAKDTLANPICQLTKNNCAETAWGLVTRVGRNCDVSQGRSVIFAYVMQAAMIGVLYINERRMKADMVTEGLIMAVLLGK